MNLVRLCIISVYEKLNKKEFNTWVSNLPPVIQKQIQCITECLKGKDIMLASSRGYLDVVRYIVKKYGVKNHKEGEYAIEFADINNHQNVVNYLTENGIKKSTVCFWVSSRSGHLDMLEYIEQDDEFKKH